MFAQNSKVNILISLTIYIIAPLLQFMWFESNVKQAFENMDLGSGKWDGIRVRMSTELAYST